MQALVNALNKALKEGSHGGICELIRRSTICFDEQHKAHELMLKVIKDLGYYSCCVVFPLLPPGYCRSNMQLKAQTAYHDNCKDLWNTSNEYCKRRRKVARRMIKELSK